jgi:hypothetical protein
MNEHHTRLCRGPEWAQHLHRDVLPTVTAGGALGDELLELGPGRARPLGFCDITIMVDWALSFVAHAPGT